MRARAGATGLAAASVSLAIGIAHAQVVTDGSLGPARALSGPIFDIDPALGQTRGGNLFHSFSAFNINSSQAAFFGGTPGLVNIVARVTGNTPSVIDGLLSAPANLYLLNPRGILFGAGASLDIAGSLHATTADYVRFATGERFQASLGVGSSLSIAPPVAFGFVDGVVGPISATRSLLIGTADTALTLIGGDVTLDHAVISLERGTVAAIGVRSAGEVVFGNDSFDTSSFTAMADVRLRQSFINVFDEPGTSVYIRGGRFVMEDRSFVAANAIQPGPQRVIDVDVDSLQLDTSAIATASSGDALGVPIRIRADDIAVGRSAGVVAAAGGSRTGGDIDVQTGSLTINGNETDTTDLSVFGTGTVAGTGRAGNLTVHASTIDITGGGLSALTTSAGSGGDITVVADRVSLHGASTIAAGTGGSGNGGRVSITARELDVDAGTSPFITSINVTSGAITSDAGAAGTIEIHADDLRLSNGHILSSTAGPGNGGAIDIAAHRARLEQGASIASDTGLVSSLGPAATYGSGGSIRLQADSLQVLSGSRISANTGSVQNTVPAAAGGNVLISAGDLTLRDRATISVNTFGRGTAGRIEIDGGSLDIAGGSAISAASFGQVADAGDANSVSITAREISLSDTGQVTTATHGSGAAGRLQIESDQLTIASGGLLQSSSLSVAPDAGAVGDLFIDSDRVVIDGGSINARSAGGGGPGSIAIRSNSMFMRNGAVLSAVSTGSSDAGSIGIAALDRLQLEGFSSISTEAQLAAGGNIALIVGNGLFVQDSTISTSVLGGSANGGNILIDPILVMLDSSAIVARAVGGNGGAIDIVTNLLLRSADSVIDASSELGIAGRIGIVGFDADLNADIAPLPSDFLDAQQWLAQPCANRLGTDVSRFTVVGRDGAYRSPLDFMPSPLTFDTPDTTSTPAAGVLDAASFASLLAGIRCR